MKTTIGILTYHFTNNYGGLLQAYALRKFLKNQNYNVSFINYHPKHIEEGGKFLNIFSLVNIKPNILILYKMIINFVYNVFGNKKLKVSFKDFKIKKLGIKGKRINDIKTLNKYSKKFDVLIAGSDQIWNFSEQYGIDETYFLNFGSKNNFKISYAASFGANKINYRYNNKIKNLIKNFDRISVREHSALRILKKNTKKKISVVPDPTLLIDNYHDLLTGAKVIKKDYLFCYNLRDDRVIRDVCNYISKLYNLEIITPFNINRRWRQIGKTVYPSPKEWLKLIFSAKIVVTNTFHGTIFSLLFKKNFIAVSLQKNKSKYNARVNELLEKVKLKNRIVKKFDLKHINSLLKNKINWTSVMSKKNQFKSSGQNFLIKSIQSRFFFKK